MSFSDYSRPNLIQSIQDHLMGSPTSPTLEGSLTEPEAPNPADIYLTGLLYPNSILNNPSSRELEQQNLQNEIDEVILEDTDFQDGKDPGDGVGKSLLNKPSSCGLSFSVKSYNQDPPILKVTGHIVLYRPQWKGQLVTKWEPNIIAFMHTLKISKLSRSGETEVQIDAPKSILQDLPFDLKSGLKLAYKQVQVDSNWKITLTLLNRLGIDPVNPPSPFHLSEYIFFQSHFKIELDKGLFTPHLRNNLASNELDRDTLVNQLIYRQVKNWAYGHTCSATWGLTNRDNKALSPPSYIETDWFPKQHVFSMSADGHALFQEQLKTHGGSQIAIDYKNASSSEILVQLLKFIPRAYAKWLQQQKDNIDLQTKQLNIQLSKQAMLNLHEAQEVLRRINEGLDLINKDPLVFEAFKLAQEAMQTQYAWKVKGAKLKWRPFQLGFQLMTLASLVNGQSPQRKVMDLLWFPTGGGKTEAYLGLIAFLIFYRRLRDQQLDHRGEGVACLMRYTLRLLTVQQFERATALILACEKVRQKHVQLRNGQAISIGMWVGNTTTPKSVVKARQNRELAIKVRQCPCCHQTLSWDPGAPSSTDLIPYKVVCTNHQCELSSWSELPIYTIDELIFQKQPSLVIGTVDKFAQIVRTQSIEDPQSQDTLKYVHGGSFLFGYATGHRPPEFIIQDELHLIAGPLGTLCALYETAIDRLCYHNEIPPKIIGSTATICRAEQQVSRLFDRDTSLFPPPVLDHNDSFFAVEDQTIPGRIYMGMSTVGQSPTSTLSNLQTTLLQNVADPYIIPITDRDPWWTLLTYFNSLRELGGTLVLMRDHLPSQMKVKRQLFQPHLTSNRELDEIPELTSRLRSEELPIILEKLNHCYTPNPSLHTPNPPDAALATNMISVGVDLPRLGLMIINGQPCSMAEYIQASSRVGRNQVPGLIITLYNAKRPRDQSCYESFRVLHSALYQQVEALTVTPFAPRAREKALHAPVVALARHLIGSLNDEQTASQFDATSKAQLSTLCEFITKRIDPSLGIEQQVKNEIDDFLNHWERQVNSIKRYWDDRKLTGLLVSWETQAVLGSNLQAKPTPNSMRDVESSTWLRIVNFL